MRILIGILLALLLFAAPAQADFRITVDGITYESSFADKRVNYIVNGKIVAYLRKNNDKGRWEFVDTNDNLIGYAVEVKTGYAYFDKYGNPAGTVENMDNNHCCPAKQHRLINLNYRDFVFLVVADTTDLLRKLCRTS